MASPSTLFTSSPELLVPDKLDDVSSFLPSFADLRRKNLDALYGDGDDKSPKGSVDVAIRELCGWVNSHPSFVTLSSCSGRIAIFDPKDSCDNDEGDDERGGKGRGEWILVSHEPIDPNLLPPLLSNDRTGKVIFKHEPLLLHVAASSLDRGRQLLSLALQLGFRESGLVVTPLRVTVAIRSHSLALTVPLAYSGPLRPTDAYLFALVEEANQQMKSNMQKLNRLETEIKRELFRESQTVAGTDNNQQVAVYARFTKLPALNLWGHDAVAVPSSKDGASTNVYVFGGYGSGPCIQGNDEAGKVDKVGRSNRIYCIRRCADGNMDSEWRSLEQITMSPKETTTWFGVEIRPKVFFPCEGLQACLLPLDQFRKDGEVSSPLIAIWGGRSGPLTPYGDLILYEPETRPGCFSEPIDVRGDHPSPRWGHTLTALSGKDGMMAILIGGRDEEASSPENVYILSLVDDGEKCVFTWKRVHSSIPPQFHHSVAALDDDLLVIFYGLSDPNNLMESVADSNYTIVERASRHKDTEKSFVAAFRVTRGALVPVSLPRMDDFIPRFGASSCCLIWEGAVVIPFIGGVPRSDGGDATDAIRWYQFDRDSLSNFGIYYEPLHLESINFSAMVHNCCVSLNQSSELLILGGGMSSFAFGAAFADTSITKALHTTTTTTPAHEVHPKENVMERMANVFHVTDRNAKALRTALDAECLLDKTFRMGQADTGNATSEDGVTFIAVPVKKDALRSLSGPKPPPWAHLVIASGLQKMRPSSSFIGSQKQRSR
ncbi:Methyltransferase TYW3 [Fragilaria crotonensis]|nr:Methyltransferase TYW3 [Fragilaria crotonensis]